MLRLADCHVVGFLSSLTNPARTGKLTDWPPGVNSETPLKRAVEDFATWKGKDLSELQFFVKKRAGSPSSALRE
jgi:hypothetical protein